MQVGGPLGVQGHGLPIQVSNWFGRPHPRVSSSSMPGADMVVTRCIPTPAPTGPEPRRPVRFAVMHFSSEALFSGPGNTPGFCGHQNSAVTGMKPLLGEPIHFLPSGRRLLSGKSWMSQIGRNRWSEHGRRCSFPALCRSAGSSLPRQERDKISCGFEQYILVDLDEPIAASDTSGIRRAKRAIFRTAKSTCSRLA